MYLKCSSNLNHSTSLPKPSLIYILPYKTKDMCIAHTVWHTSRTIPKKKYPKSTFLSALCLNVQVHRFWLSSVTYPNLMGKNSNLPPPKKLPGVSVVSSCSPKPSTSQWREACGTWHQRWCSHSNGACCANVALAMLSVKNASCCPIQPNKRHQIKSESVQVMGAQKWYLAYLEYLQKMIQKNVYMKIACTFIFIPQKIGKICVPCPGTICWKIFGIFPVCFFW